jgi:O-antigen/teichoic acid export membrane protein
MQFSQSLLNGLFEIKLSSIIEKLKGIVLFFLLPIIYFINQDFFKSYFMEIVVILIIISLISGIRLSLQKILMLISFKKVKLFYFPKGFWSFLLTAQVMSMLSYFFNNFDKIIVAQYFGIKELGIYSVIILIWIMTRIVPQLIAKTQIPLMSKYIKEGNSKELEKVFYLLNRYTILFSIFLGFFLLIFSNEILIIFGSEYATHSSYLNILVLTSSLLTLSYSVTPLMISLEYNKIRLINSIVQIIIQFLITIVLLNAIGMMAVILGVAISIVLAQLYPLYKIFKLKEYKFNFPKDFLVGSILTFLLFLFIIVLDIENIFYKFVFLVFFCFLYM